MATREDIKQTALLNILRGSNISAEGGVVWDDFTSRNSDSLDFANISRATLFNMLQDAYDAGHDMGGRSNRSKR